MNNSRKEMIIRDAKIAWGILKQELPEDYNILLTITFTTLSVIVIPAILSTLLNPSTPLFYFTSWESSTIFHVLAVWMYSGYKSITNIYNKMKE